MSTHGIFCRAAFAFWVFAVIGAGSQSASAQSTATFRNIRVDVAPLRANAGDPTAAWVQQELPGQLVQALAGRMALNGAPLTVRIDYLTLGPSTGEMLHASASLDNISGVAIIGGQQTPVRATSSYYSSPVDQTMIERSTATACRSSPRCWRSGSAKARSFEPPPQRPSWGDGR